MSCLGLRGLVNIISTRDYLSCGNETYKSLSALARRDLCPGLIGAFSLTSGEKYIYQTLEPQTAMKSQQKVNVIKKGTWRRPCPQIIIRDDVTS